MLMPGLRENAGEYSGLIGDFAKDRLAEGNAGVNAAQNYGVDVLSGQYLTQNNPYFQDMLGNALDASTNRTQAALGVRGLTGSSNMADAIARENAKVATSLAYNDYGRERGAMDAAAGRAGSIAAAEYLPIQGLMSSIGVQQAPLNAASQYAGGLGGLLGGYQTQSGRPGFDALGTAAQIGSAALFASERRVKKNIARVGTLPDGLGVYEYHYIDQSDDAPIYRGVMVDEVEKLRPWALGPIVNGVQTVDYSQLEAR